MSEHKIRKRQVYKKKNKISKQTKPTKNTHPKMRHILELNGKKPNAICPSDGTVSPNVSHSYADTLPYVFIRGA